MDKNQMFVEFVQETVDMAIETCITKAELEEWIHNSWSCDGYQRREAVGNKKLFRQHVLNVLDAEHPEKSFS